MTGWQVGSIAFAGLVVAVEYAHAYAANGHGTASVYTTDTISPPTGGEAYLVFVTETALVNPTTPPSLSGLGLTWSLVASFDDSFDNRALVSVFQGVGTPTAGTITATLDTPSSGHVFLLDFVAISGVNPTSPVVSWSSTPRTSAQTISVTHSGFADAANIGIAFGFTAEVRSPGDVNFDPDFDVIPDTFVQQAGDSTAYDRTQVLGIGAPGDTSVTFDTSITGHQKWVWLFELDAA